MIINFRKITEVLFKSFDVAWDTKLIEKFETDWIRFLMIIKRHWIYAIISSWRVIFVWIIAFVNIYLLAFANENPDNISIIISILLAINVIYWIYIVIKYIYSFCVVQWNKPYIEDIYSAIKKSKDSDWIFTKFYNQTIFLLIFLFWITIFSIFTSVTNILENLDWTFSFWVINAALLIVQLLLFYSFLNKMINLEMDYKLVIPWKIFFYNQRWIFWDSQTMNSNKIKTINTKYSWILNSLFNYWDIIVLSEWDKENNWEMQMDYVGYPQKTVEEMNKVLNNDLSAIEKDVNVLLSKYINEIWIPDINTPENKEKLKDFVNSNQEKLKTLFENADSETKNEIREIFIIIQ